MAPEPDQAMVNQSSGRVVNIVASSVENTHGVPSQDLISEVETGVLVTLILQKNRSRCQSQVRPDRRHRRLKLDA